MSSHTGFPAAFLSDTRAPTISVAKLLDIVKDDSTRKNGAAVLYDIKNIYTTKIVESSGYYGRQSAPNAAQMTSTTGTISQSPTPVNIVSLRTDDTRPYDERARETKTKLTQATHGLPSEQWQAVIADQLPMLVYTV